MRLLSVYYFKDGEGVDTFNEADEAHIYESGGDGRSGNMVILGHKDRGILPKNDGETVETTEEEMDKLFGDDDDELTAASNEKGDWITVNGTHIFIPDGKSTGDVLKEHFDNLDKKKREDSKDTSEKKLDELRDRRHSLKNKPELSPDEKKELETIQTEMDKIREEKHGPVPKETPKIQKEKTEYDHLTYKEVSKMENDIESEIRGLNSDIYDYKNNQSGPHKETALKGFREELKELNRQLKEIKKSTNYYGDDYYEGAVEEKGEWITSNGQHIFIPEGKDIGDTVREHFDKLDKEKPKKEKLTDAESSWKSKHKVVGRKIDEEDVKIVENIWNSIPQPYREGVNDVIINEVGFFETTAGMYNVKTKDLTVNIDPNFKNEFIKTVMFHEAAHAKYNITDQKKKDEWKKWVDENPDLHDVTKYSKRFFDNVAEKVAEVEKHITKSKESIKWYADLEIPTQVEYFTEVLKSWEESLKHTKEVPYNELQAEIFSNHHHPRDKPSYELKSDKLEIAYKKYKEILE